MCSYCHLVWQKSTYLKQLAIPIANSINLNITRAKIIESLEKREEARERTIVRDTEKYNWQQQEFDTL